MRALLSARWRLLRRSAVALLASVVVGSGAAGFAAGQVAVHLTGGLALTPPTVAHHQQSGQVQGSLGQRVGAQVAHQTVVRTAYTPPASTRTKASPRQSGSPGGKHADNGHGKGGKGNGGGHGEGDHGKGDHGKHGKGDGHDGHGKGGSGGHGGGKGGSGGHGHGSGGGRGKGGHGHG